MKRTVRIVVIALLVFGVGWWLLSGGGEPEVARGSVLTVDLAGSYVERAAPSLVNRIAGDRGQPLGALLSELAKAERDDRIGAVVFRVGGLQLGWAKAQELRAAIARLREAGRRPVAVLEVEKFGGNLEFFVASAADEIYLVPGARAPLVGLASEYMFLGGLWEKLGVEIETERVGAYKTAVDSYTASGMSEPFREMATWLLDSIDAQFVGGIADGRGLEIGAVRAAVDHAPIGGRALVELGLADGIAFHDEVIEKLGGPELALGDYAAVSLETVGFAPEATLALIHATGPVVTGKGDAGLSGGSVIAADTVSKALLDAAEDPGIDGIVLRIDSPGGSALASDLVWRAVERARASKPVIASMSDVAASGGYYIAAGADAIVAEPGTLTGSIGVFVLRPVVGGLLDKVGVHTEVMTRGRFADILTGSQPLDPATRARLRSDVESVYEQFVARVAAGRDMTPEAVDAIARGRVWTGAQALENGLVDAVGGLREAVDAMREKLELAEGVDVALMPYPPPKPLALQLRELMSGGLRASLAAEAWAETAALALPEPLRHLVSWLAPLPTGAPVLLPPIAVRIR